MKKRWGDREEGGERGRQTQRELEGSGERERGVGGERERR